MDYVAGFLFHGERVLLVQKSKPTWQAGLWNAVGGKINAGEQPMRAMTREFYEETGQLTGPEYWTHFCTERGRDYVVHFFSSRVPLDIPHIDIPARNDADESLEWYHAGLYMIPVVGNLRWLVPLALDWRGLTTPVVVYPDKDIRERASW